jgi:hypothetical protein
VFNRAQRGESARHAGCLSKDSQFPSREAAEEWIEWKVATSGASMALWNVYSCRYAKPGHPHYHAGHKPGQIRNFGRMPEPDRTVGRRRKRRHSR